MTPDPASGDLRHPLGCLLLLHATDTLVSMSGSVTDLFDRRLGSTVADLAEVAMDAVYLGVGAGVLTFQKVQVQRRELQTRLEGLGQQVFGR